ncbi:unnamed protein product [Rotaria magnacalcarata]|uniref:Uncharacterized protein n=1 Tax=Rotaria magnacalcarata TaxID=392030 RepID=A0A8S2WQD1_9BILA|nr:unnamed protein product [Rotaria magnacalcarata]
MSQFNPNRRRFYSYIDLEEFVSHKINPTVIPNMTVYFDQPWLSNIGHALFDGLYPAFVALIRFQPKHLQPFRILLHIMSDNGKYSFSQSVYNVFAGLGTMNASVLEKNFSWKMVCFSRNRDGQREHVSTLSSIESSVTRWNRIEWVEAFSRSNVQTGSSGGNEHNVDEVGVGGMKDDKYSVDKLDVGEADELTCDDISVHNLVSL